MGECEEEMQDKAMPNGSGLFVARPSVAYVRYTVMQR